MWHDRNMNEYEPDRPQELSSEHPGYTTESRALRERLILERRRADALELEARVRELEARRHELEASVLRAELEAVRGPVATREGGFWHFIAPKKLAVMFVLVLFGLISIPAIARQI